MAELEFRTDLYEGTAPFYDRFRAPYPRALFDDLCQRLPVSGNGRLLDLACGTGQIAFPLAGQFSEVVAVDQERELVAFGRAKARSAGISNITWLAGSAETVDLHGSFELVAIGSAFHRLQRAAVAERSWSWLQRGGGVALVWSDVPWQGDRRWQRALEELAMEWAGTVGGTDRIPAGWEAVMDRDPHEQVLARAGFDYVGRFEFDAPRTWSVESLAGFLYSTSFLNHQLLADSVAAFEKRLSERLLSCQPDGVFVETARSAYQLARKT